MISLRALPLAGLLLATATVPALAAPAAAPPKSHTAAASAAAPADNAPFYTGHPMGAAFRAAQKQRIARAKAAIARMLAVKGPRTLDNTLVPYDEAGRLIDMANNQAGLLEVVSPDAATRAAAEKASQDVVDYATTLTLDRRVYDAIAALDVSNADPATRHYVEHTLMEFKLAGVDKDSTTRAQIKALSDSLVEIGQEFSRNIREDHTTVSCTVADLDGLPQDFIRGHKPGADGRIALSIEYPDLIPVLQYAKSDDLRHRMYLAAQNRAYPANIGVLDRMRARRHELAKLVGYSNFADYVTADKMVGSAKNAHDFIDRVVAASADRQAREYQQLLAAKKKMDPSATAVTFWEFPYIREQVQKADYNFDSQSVRPYFPYARVQEGVLTIMSHLFGVEFKRVPNAPVWHPSVECYELWDGGKLAGRFYLDMHPRPNKYNHAAQFGIRAGIEGRQIPEAALVCNLSGGKPGDPGLCDMDDVNTFFHEFGHLMHNMFAQHSRWYGINGITTEQDFVEAPSQMLEEWMRNPGVLASFGRHYQTGKPIPEELVRQMNRANDFGKGLDVRRQMVYAALSLDCYDRDPAGVSTDGLIKELVEKYQPFAFVDGTHFQCAFGHLDGYSAVYYTYMWSLVIAKDMFSQFDKNNLLAPGVAKRYREAVLEPGGSKPAAELVATFLGRPFNEQAWKKWLDSDE
ncbi:MAG TPA: M3 family metallopeptidase [Candidatus Acidoferrales bacterium]|nr:M3 family metallopeptidase [Candidatus Acidoferrales bacterium]